MRITMVFGVSGTSCVFCPTAGPGVYAILPPFFSNYTVGATFTSSISSGGYNFTFHPQGQSPRIGTNTAAGEPHQAGLIDTTGGSTLNMVLELFARARPSVDTAFAQYGGAPYGRWDTESQADFSHTVQLISLAFADPVTGLPVSGFSVMSGNGQVLTPAPCLTLGATPQSASVPPGGFAIFNVSADGAGPMSFAWARNGQPVADGTGPGGATISGAATASLRLESIGAADAGLYTVTVTNACGVATADATLSLPASCDPDMTCDGNSDQDDVACLINAVAGNPGCECQDTDFNRDGNVDQDDVAALINVVAGGTCP